MCSFSKDKKLRAKASEKWTSKVHLLCLPLDNGGYPFEWVSNHQVISAIHLQPHKTKNRTFLVAAKEKKTVVDAMKTM